MGKLKVSVLNNYGELAFSLEKLDELSRIFEEYYLDEKDYKVDFTIVDDEEIQFLNKNYRNKDAVTDVLSFADQEVKDLFPVLEDDVFLGEIVISYPQVLRQSKEFENNEEREFYLLLSHGLLHLLGHDHMESEEAEKMEKEEDKILKLLFK